MLKIVAVGPGNWISAEGTSGNVKDNINLLCPSMSRESMQKLQKLCIFVLISQRGDWNMEPPWRHERNISDACFPVWAILAEGSMGRSGTRNLSFSHSGTIVRSFLAKA